MMFVERLLALWQPVEATCTCDMCDGHTWGVPNAPRPRLLEMQPVKVRAVILVNIRAAERAIPSMSRLWRRVQGHAMEGIAFQAPEMGYLRNVTAT